ncbi:DUF3300 domain-containing protein [Comamonas resistens]|uniref:DUF3300 domain-containing protein n=1 Tax=Comamonas resistens TaxID=3046670 RepID=A0ABY8SQ29_9BURK|nr:DUF3300 domain-containing protein [Comamonas resistens]MDL5038567.1 DUF3300 domain-containing protein [Comamonas resistens]WHS64054.1 DUF3300 domain-containing protein [Comamonas resistens]
MSYPSTKNQQSWRLAATACAALALLSACNDKDKPAASDTTTAPPQTSLSDSGPATGPQPIAPVAYTPPSAEVLYQMVAPIALYPDKLVAQILAGATYPEQVTAAESWLGQNPGLQKTAMSNAVNAQNWDPSIKSLTQFPNVLEQLASNLPWTTALGKAYYNDPADVLNAIQVMRNRAYKAGTLKSSKHLVVSAGSAPSQGDYTPSNAVSAIPQAVIAPPEQYIEIAPSEVSTVYVPQYDPGVVYGEPLPVYGGYNYVSAPVAVGVGVPVAAGLLGFGAGVLLAQASMPHPSWGWHSWDMHWGAPERHDWRPGMPPPPPMARPAVVYNNQTYISQSRTVRTVVQNNQHTENVRVTNIYENGAPSHAMPQAAMATGVGAAAGAAVLAASHGIGSRQVPVQQAMPPTGQPPSPQTARMPSPAGTPTMPAMPMHQQAHAQGIMDQRAGMPSGQAQILPQQKAPQAMMQQQHQQQLQQAQHEQQQRQQQAQMQAQQQAQQQAALHQQQLAQQRAGAQSQQKQAEQQAQMQQRQQQQQLAQQQAQREATQHQQQMAQQHAAQQQRQAEQQAQIQQRQQQQQLAQREQQQAQREAAQRQQQQQMAQQRAAQQQQRQAEQQAQMQQQRQQQMQQAQREQQQRQQQAQREAQHQQQMAQQRAVQMQQRQAVAHAAPQQHGDHHEHR